MSTMSWTEFEPFLAERLTGVIEHQPEVLLEHDGGPEGLKADIILAVLYGMDGQVDALWRIPKVTHALLRPIRRRLSLRADPDEMTSPSIATARYVLQSSWATMTLDYLAHRDFLPPDVKPSPGTNEVTAALLRYRHRI